MWIARFGSRATVQLFDFEPARFGRVDVGDRRRTGVDTSTKLGSGEAEMRYRRWVRAVLAVLGLLVVLVPGLPPAAVGGSAVGRPAAEIRWNLQRIEAERAWAITRGDPSIVVGIIDTGIDPQHPELAGRVVAGSDFSGGNDTTDADGHGTFVAGITAGAGIEAPGVAPRASVMPLKVFGKNSTFSPAWVAEAIRYGVNHGARIVNLSLRLPIETQEIKEAIDDAYARGVLVVCSAGNQGGVAGEAPVQYPANHPLAFAVTSTGVDDKKAAYASNAPWVRVAAPGGAYRADGNIDPKQAIYGPQPGGRYDYLQGTSFAAPHVAGLAALVWSANPKLKVEDVMQIVMHSADPQEGLPHPNPVSGWGRINAWRAVRAALPRDLQVHAETIARWENGGALKVRGWVEDRSQPGFSLGDVIEAVEVHRDGPPGQGQLLTRATYGIGVPGAPLPDTGFSADLDPDQLEPGETSLWVGARTILGEWAWSSVTLPG